MKRGIRRFSGVQEHLERIRLFFGMAQANTDAVKKFRLMIAAVYSCRAATELMLEAAEKQELLTPKPSAGREALEAHLAPRIPFYYLIERIRIHDFHRFGVLPPDPHEAFLGGPLKLTGRRGMAAVSMTPQGPVYKATGESTVKPQRPLLIQGGQFFDDETQRFVTLGEVLAAFLEQAPGVIEEMTAPEVKDSD